MSDEIAKKLNLTPTHKKPNNDSNHKADAVKLTVTKSEKMWEKLRAVDLQMFGLQNQTLELYCKPIPANPEELTLKIIETKKNATGVVSVMSQVLTPKYEVELRDRYIVVRDVEE